MLDSGLDIITVDLLSSKFDILAISPKLATAVAAAFIF
jgi:hypothetical protein